MKTNKENTPYSIGLDIGTNSVGWAVMDDNFKLIKKGKNNLWGSRLFDSAQSAAARRIFRSSRRKYNRRRMRIGLLQELMNETISTVDDTFFIRIGQTSFLDEDDKKEVLKDRYKDNYNLFIDSKYNDSDYFKQFPTIYHLRLYLMKNKEKVDPRLIYLALHHIVKYRGHFLYEGQSLSSDITNINDQLVDVFNQLNVYLKQDYQIEESDVQKMIQYFKDESPKSVKVDNCLVLFEGNNCKSYKELLNAIVGNSFNLSKMLNNNNINGGKNIKISFSKNELDDVFTKYESALSDYMEFINDLHAIYSWVELQGILNYSDTLDDDVTISKAMVARYNKHHQDLKILKTVIKKYLTKEYDRIFRTKDMNKLSYNSYIYNPKNNTRDSFYKFLLKYLDQCPSDDLNVQYCKQEIEKNNFLLKQNDKTNANVPYQLHAKEMELILNNQAQYYPELMKNADLIKKLHSSRIPYYVGPLNEKSEFAWVVKKDMKQEFKPWNIEEIIDVEATAEKFIQRMLSHCTYLPLEYVMPKNSLTANMYEVLSELNKIRVDGKLLPLSTKHKIIQDLFMNNKTVTDQALKKWFKVNQVFLNNDDLEITGYQKDKAFASSLSSWIDFKKIFNNIDANYNLIEDIIRDLTIFEDKSILKRRLKNIKELSSEQIDYLLKIKKRYKGWSRLSRKLIDGIYGDNRFGSHCTILDVMKDSHLGLMEIINDKDLGFKQIIENANTNFTDGPFTIDEVASLYGSPAIKRGIWQSLQILEEITTYMKHRPNNIFIEFAREEGKKERTTTQVKDLQQIYQVLNKEKQLVTKEQLAVFNHLKKENASSKLNSERLYLYYTQMGKCMYTGRPLDISNLHLYEVDHIVPRSMIKDDSLDNKVLVIKDANQRKSDDQTLSNEIIDNNIGYWDFLLKYKLITSKKYSNLIRREYDEHATVKFINRQLVETRQIIKNVAQLVANHYSSTKVVAIRSNLTHQFRNKYKVYKLRDVNDYHHAHDAYITCVIGLFIQKRFPKLEARYLYTEYMKIYKTMEKQKYNDGFVLNAMNYDKVDYETGEIIWQKDNISYILKCFYYKDCYISRMLEDYNSSLFNVTIMSADKKSNKEIVPVNKGRKNVQKYGGFRGLNYEFFAIEGLNNRNKIVRKIIGVPLVYKNYPIFEKIKIIETNEQLKNVKIIKQIKKYQLIEYQGGKFYITGAMELVNAQQLILDKDMISIINDIHKASAIDDYDDISDNDISIIFDVLLDKMGAHYPLYKTIQQKIISKKDGFMNLTRKDRCNVILQLLKVTHANAENGNIKYNGFAFGDRIGRLSKKTILLDNAIFIEKSVTGIYRKRVRL